MGIFSILLTGFALSMDAFAVSVTKGMTLKKINLSIATKIAFLFGLFQAVMPLIGWLFGMNFELYIRSIDHWIAVFLLSFLGIKMIVEAIKDDDNDNSTYLDNKELIILSIATSIDALAVGHLTYVENRGAAFGMFQNNQIIFIIVALVASIYGLYYLHTKKVDTVGKVGILLIISGAIGNLIDRVRLGFVVDYFDFRIIWEYVFNIADIFVVLGTILLCIYILFYDDNKEKQK